ncbi:hypothetical protein KKC97_00925, partial [bacterium]|nr:hypothetical protein [bacterium]
MIPKSMLNRLLLCCLIGLLTITTTSSTAQLSVEIPEAVFDNGHSALDIPFTRMSDHIVLQAKIDGNREV